MKKIIISLVAIGLSFSMAASAQTPDSAVIKDAGAGSVNFEAQQLKIQQKEALEAARTAREAAVTQAKEQREALKLKAVESKEKLQAERAALNRSVEADKANREAFKQRAEQEKEAIKLSREEFKQKAEQTREDMKASREEFKNKIEVQKKELKTKREEQRAELKTKLEKIKDERKKAVVEKLDKRFDEINVKTTTQWTNALIRLEDLLVKISLRADKAAENGADVSAINSALEKAKTAIVAARAAITAQASKTYPIDIVSEAELRSAVAQTRDRLNQDLKAVREVMRSAQQAVVDALTSLKGVPKVDEASSATSTSATPVPESGTLGN